MFFSLLLSFAWYCPGLFNKISDICINDPFLWGEKLLNLQRLYSVSFSCLSLCDFHKVHLDHQLQVINFFIVLRLFYVQRVVNTSRPCSLTETFQRASFNSKISSNILFNVYHSLTCNFTFNSSLIIIQRRDLMPDKYLLWRASRKEFKWIAFVSSQLLDFVYIFTAKGLKLS